jgi:hypothetical protein
MLSFNVSSEMRNNDPFFDILNSTDGKIFDATLNTLLRNARLHRKEETDRWFPDIKSFYSNILTNGSPSKGFLWSVSGNLPQFGYLDMIWVEEMIDKIFPQNDETWKFCMLIYHRQVNTVYKSLFDILYRKGHYHRAIEVFTGEVKGTDDICRHIVLSCLAEWSGHELSNPTSLTNLIINRQEVSQLKGIISYFYTNRTYDKQQMLDIWDAIVSKVSINEDEICRDLLKLTESVIVIDEKAYRIISKTLSKINNKDDLYFLLGT